MVYGFLGTPVALPEVDASLPVTSEGFPGILYLRIEWRNPTPMSARKGLKSFIETLPCPYPAFPDIIQAELLLGT